MAIPDLKGYQSVSKDTWEQAHKKGAYVWVYDDGLWNKAKYDDPDGDRADKVYVTDGIGSYAKPVIYATASQEEFDWGLYNAGHLLREPVPLSESTRTYQDAKGKEVTEDQAAVIDSKRHPELLQDPDWLARHPELAPPSYAEYGMVALGAVVIGVIIYIGWKAFKVKK